MSQYLNVHGLPAHPLIVHATVVLVPLAAILVLGSACWPRLRRRAGHLTPVVAAIALALVPLSTHTGEQLQARLPGSALVARHAQLADGLLPWVFGLFVAAIVTTVVHRRERPAVAALSVAAVAVALLTAAGTVVQVVRIGDSGANAAWHDVPRTALPGGR